MSDDRRLRKFTAQHKTELVVASLRGPKTITELCREHDISDRRDRLPNVYRELPRSCIRYPIREGRLIQARLLA